MFCLWCMSSNCLVLVICNKNELQGQQLSENYKCIYKGFIFYFSSHAKHLMNCKFQQAFRIWSCGSYYWIPCCPIRNACMWLFKLHGSNAEWTVSKIICALVNTFIWLPCLLWINITAYCGSVFIFCVSVVQKFIKEVIPIKSHNCYIVFNSHICKPY